MRKIYRSVTVVLLALLFITGCALLPSYMAGATTTDEIQIGTYNLEFFTDLDPSTGAWCEQHTKHTVANIKALASFIDSLDIGVLALQEVEDSAALDRLLSYMPTGKYSYIVSHQENQCQRVAVLYQPSSVSLTYEEEIPLNPPGHSHLRDGLVVKGKVLPDGFDFTLVVVHLKAYFDSASEETRDQQLTMLGSWISGYFADQENDPDLIIAGDFNEHLLTNAAAFALLDSNLGLKDLDQDSPNKTCTPNGQYYSNPIDHIIISPNAENEYEGVTTIDNYFTDSTLPYRDTFSDHCVLWSDFSTEDLDGKPISPPPPPPVNEPQTTPGEVVINEVEANPSGSDSGNEWVELYNTGTTTVDIGGWSITGTHGRTATVTIPYGTTIQPGQFLVYYRSKQWLDNEGEVVNLCDSMGNLVDMTPTLNDTSNNALTWCRVPDGSGSWIRQASTKGYSNSGAP